MPFICYCGTFIFPFYDLKTYNNAAMFSLILYHIDLLKNVLQWRVTMQILSNDNITCFYLYWVQCLKITTVLEKQVNFLNVSGVRAVFFTVLILLGVKELLRLCTPELLTVSTSKLHDVKLTWSILTWNCKLNSLLFLN